MDLYEAIEIICKDYCKYPNIESGNKLADICDKCPMNKCEDLRWADRKTEPQTIRCPKCGRSDYIREFGKDFSVTAEEAGFKYKCINCNTYIEPQSERSK